MKKMLLVTYIFPPLAAVGVYRILKFCKYLREFGIEPIVLTPRNPNTRTFDENLVRQIPDGIRVIRPYTLEPFRIRETPAGESRNDALSSSKNPTDNNRPPSFGSKLKRSVGQFLAIPDQQYLWSWAGLLRGIQVVRKNNIDIVLSSSPPPSTHVLASRIARLTNRPHVADFRDLWTQNTSYSERNFPTNLLRRDRRFEENVLRRAAGISVNTASFKEQLLEKNGFLSQEKIEMVTNGVDPCDFENLNIERGSNRKFTMLYTGSIYSKHRNPEFFLVAVRKWLDSRPDVVPRISIEFMGNWDAEFIPLVEKHNLSKVVHWHGWKPQVEAMASTMNADLLLLLQGFDSALSAAVPRKLYEYMITNRPILAFAPPGEIPNLIERYQCGVSLSEPNPEPIVDFLNRTYNSWDQMASTDSNKLPLRSMPELETRTQVKKLAEFCFRLM